MTLAGWAALPEDVEGELVDGVLVDEEAADLTHATVVAFLVQLLSAWLVPRGGFVFGSEAKFAVAPRRGRKPDVTAYLKGTRLPRRGIVTPPPHIAIEVVSPTARDGRRDRIDKPDDYAAFGVRFYWIVDPQQRSLEILELGSDRRYVRALGASDAVVEAVPGCEGLTIDLPALWAEIDRLEDAEE